MTTSCSYQLTSFEPIVYTLIIVKTFPGGLEVTESHRHFAGAHGDCPAASYFPLTADEASDVLCATVMGHVARAPFSET